MSYLVGICVFKPLVVHALYYLILTNQRTRIGDTILFVLTVKMQSQLLGAFRQSSALCQKAARKAVVGIEKKSFLIGSCKFKSGQ